jgi:hypothetical protein
MIFKSSLTKSPIVEISILNHSFSLEEYQITKKALELYSPAIWVPMGIELSTPNYIVEKRQFYQDIVDIFQEYSPEWAFSIEEIKLIKNSLNHFNSLPLPLYENISIIRERKKEKKIVKSILIYLDESFDLNNPGSGLLIR